MRTSWAWALGGFLWAQAVTGDLVVISETGDAFRLYLNGEWIAETPVTRAEAHDLPAGPQRALLYIHPSEGRIIQLRKTFFVEEGFVEYFAIRKKKGQYTVTLYNRVPRSAAAPPPVEQPTALPTPPPPVPPSPQPSTATSGAPSQNQNTTIIFNPTIQVQTGSGTQVNAPAPGGASQPGIGTPPPPASGSTYTGPCNCTHPTPSSTVQAVVATLEREGFDDTKLEMAKTFVQQNCLWSRDVRTLLSTLRFEENKLQLAKWAYAYVHDVSAYATVSEVFSFSSSKEELMRHIRAQPPRQQCYASAGGGASSGTGTPTPSTLPPCQPCMSPAAFSQALTSVRNTSSEVARLEVARQIATTNCLSAQQVRELCRAFTSEANRLTFAKEAFNRCCDRENYFLVNEAFVSNASREELSQYIQGLMGR